jgi:hypothetical protein
MFVLGPKAQPIKCNGSTEQAESRQDPRYNAIEKDISGRSAEERRLIRQHCE